MNERIRLLAKGNERVQNFFETGPVQRAAIEDFAEQVVRECARIADRKYLYSKEPNRWDSGFNISCEILEQFGILKDE